jgi:hypothetical protein
MLDAWIIKKIREKEKVKDDRPALQLPLPEQEILPKKESETKEERGVIIIDIGGDE